ncbi:MAG: VOC family protein [Deltaproteobacteria bacterium]|nr:VOC family protein [Deltaproteobacteria bacterium]
MPLALHHVALGAKDVATVARFYADLFELRELDRHHHEDGRLRSVWLELAGAPTDDEPAAILMVEQTDEPERPVDMARGPFLLAFRLAKGERAGFEERLARRGIAIERRSAYSSYFRDPEGNRVAVSHHPVP